MLASAVVLAWLAPALPAAPAPLSAAELGAVRVSVAPPAAGAGTFGVAFSIRVEGTASAPGVQAWATDRGAGSVTQAASALAVRAVFASR